MYYTHRTTEFQEVPGHRATDPAFNYQFDALKIRKERQESYNGDSLPDDKKEEYLDSIGEELQARSRAFKYQIFEIGRLLCEAKKNLPHGEFQPWVEKNFELGYRTAHNCMRVFVTCMAHPEVVEWFTPSCLYLIAKPGFPEGFREALFDGTKGPVDVNKKELVQVALKYKNGEVTIDSEEVQNILKKQRKITLWEKYLIELIALRGFIDKRLGRIRSLFTLYPTNPLIESEQEDFTREDMESDITSKIEEFKAKVNCLISQLEKKCNCFINEPISLLDN
jgi:hypothetical protein